MDPATLNLSSLLPTGWEIAALVIFGVAGFIGWRHGKRQQKPAPKWIGLALMLYPYATSGAEMLWGVGIALTAALVYTWDR